MAGFIPSSNGLVKDLNVTVQGVGRFGKDLVLRGASGRAKDETGNWGLGQGYEQAQKIPSRPASPP